MSEQTNQNPQIINNFHSLNDENIINALQVLVVRTTDFAKNSILEAKLYFSNLRISYYNYYSITDESDLDLAMYFIKNQTQNQTQNQSGSEENSGQNQIQGAAPFSSSSPILVEITPSLFKKLLYLVSISIPISFNSIKIIISGSSEVNQSSNKSQNKSQNSSSKSNPGPNEEQNISQNPNFSLSTMRDLYDYLSMTTQSNSDSVFGDFFGGSPNKRSNGKINRNRNRTNEASFVIQVNSINDVNICEQFYQNYLDFLTFKKNMS